MPSRNERKKILHVTTDAHMGGAEQLMLWIAQDLDPKRFELVFCILDSKGALTDLLEQRGFRTYALNAKSFLCWPKGIKGLKKIIADEKPDVVHSHLLTAGLISLFSAHRNLHVHHRHYGNLFEKKMVLRRFFDRMLVTRVPRIIAVSEAVANDLKERMGVPGNRLVTINNAIDLNAFNPTKVSPIKNVILQDILARGHHPVLGVVGNFNPVKGHRVLINALPHILSEHPKTAVVFFGEGAGKKELAFLVQAKALQNSVFFCGYETDIASVMMRLSVLVVPSLSEGFGLVACEAMALGVPVVASRVEGLSNLILHGEDGLLFERGNAVDLAKQVNLILGNESLQKKLREQGAVKARNFFSMTRFCAELEMVYLNGDERGNG